MSDGPQGSHPQVDGPIPGPISLAATQFDLGHHRYVREEFFLSGLADSFLPVGQHGDDGHWEVEPADQAAFTTRLVVIRPIAADRFNGLVLLEWLNVSGGLDAAPDWMFVHRHLMREGAAWVGVSAQKVGIDGGGLMPGAGHLKAADPDRYGHLLHPGDAYAYDIFGQVGRTLRSPSGPSLLGPLVPDLVLAAGESQSAMFMVTYVNAVDHLHEVYDGFLIHGRGAQGTPLSGASFLEGSGPGGAQRVRGPERHRIRDDVRVPVLTFQSETDVVGLGGGRSRQADGPRFRLWELAGAAHFDTYGLMASGQDDGSLTSAELARRMAPTTEVLGATGAKPFNSGPQQHYVLQAAVAHLERWATGGAPPATAERLATTSDDAADLVLDEVGIATGGVRTPWVDVPTAVLSGRAQPGGATFAFLFGSTELFDQEELTRLHPGGLTDYLERFTQSLDDCIASGFLLPADREEILAVAEASWPRVKG